MFSLCLRGFLPLIGVGLTGDSKLSIGMNVRGCLSLYVGHVRDCDSSRVNPTSRPMSVGIGSSSPHGWTLVCKHLICSISMNKYAAIVWPSYYKLNVPLWCLWTHWLWTLYYSGILLVFILIIDSLFILAFSGFMFSPWVLFPVLFCSFCSLSVFPPILPVLVLFPAPWWSAPVPHAVHLCQIPPASPV